MLIYLCLTHSLLIALRFCFLPHFVSFPGIIFCNTIYISLFTLCFDEIHLIGFYFVTCHCNEKILDPNTTEQHFHTSLNGVFSFSISCFVLEILRFFDTCKLGVSDVIYSQIINYIYQMVNISVNSRQKFFKLCMTIAIW